MKCAAWVLLALLAPMGCGESGAPPVDPTDAAVGDGGCAPQPITNWTPTWRSPRSTLRACTDLQIETELTLCESTSSAAAECAAFNRDPANAACRQCLYTTEDESAYGPLVLMKNRLLRVNLAGCLALADGNLGAGGCGARMQAFQACNDAACLGACSAIDAFQQCITEAGNGVCQSYRDESTCADRATYASCLDHATFEDYFRAVAKVFCGQGFPGGGVRDAGAVPWPARRPIEREPIETQARWGIGKADLR